MTEAVLLILLCLASGLSLERHLSLSSLLQRVILVFTLAASQLVVSIQSLSLIRRLDGTWLLLVNVLSTALLFLLGWRKPIPDQRPWLKALHQTFGGVTAKARNDPLSRIMLA